MQLAVDKIVGELHGALEKIKDDTGRWNKSLATLKLEQQDARRDKGPAKVPQQNKRPRRWSV